MVLNGEKGGYCLGSVVHLIGAFIANGANPTVIRDGNSKCIKSVVRNSAGLFTVTFQDGDKSFPIPLRPTRHAADVQQSVAPTATVHARVVKGSYSQATRSFQIFCTNVNVPAAADPDVGDIVSFELYGAIDTPGVDPA